MQHTNNKYLELVSKTIASVLIEERIKQNKSQRVLADEYDIQKSLISRLENAKNEPKILSLLTMCEALGLKPSEFFKRFEEKLPEGFSMIDE